MNERRFDFSDIQQTIEASTAESVEVDTISAESEEDTRPPRLETLALDHDRLEGYLESLDEGLPEHLRVLEQEALADYVPIIRRPMQRYLRFLIRSRKPKKILEIGAGVGFSGLLMLEFAGEDTTLTTVENYPPRITACEKHFGESQCRDRITFYSEDAEQVIDQLLENQEAGTYDFIFLDAAKGQYPILLERLLQLLSEDGMLVTDNVLQEGELLDSHFVIPRRDRTIHKRMREYLYLLTHTKGISTEILPIGDGFSMTIKM